MITRFFDATARAITSLGAVIFILLMVTVGMTFASHTTFMRVFPFSMAEWERLTSTWLVAVAWEATVLITTSNKRLLPKGVPEFMALCSGLMMLFFLEAFDFNQDPLIIVIRWFVGLLIATIGWVYAELFWRKLEEHGLFAALPAKIKELESKVKELISGLVERDRKIDQLQSTLNDRDSKVIELESRLTDRDRHIKQLQSKIDDYSKELTCPHCKVVQSNPRALNAHKGHCEENPINKKNGTATLKALNQ